MARDDEIKLKVATIIDEAVGEKKKSRRRLLVWAGSTCAATETEKEVDVDTVERYLRLVA